MERIINLTGQPAGADLCDAGVVNIGSESLVQELLTFDEVPTVTEMERRAEQLALIAEVLSLEFDDYEVLIDGPVYFTPVLAAALRARELTPLFSYRRTTTKDGATLHEHVGFIHAYTPIRPEMESSHE